MQVFNLTNLNASQEVPKTFYRPLNISDEDVYLEKFVSTPDQIWSNGIWSYNLAMHKMHRLDQGQHAIYGDLYDIETPMPPYGKLDNLDREHIYFATITELKDENYIEFYEIDLVSNLQKAILAIKFNKNEVVYQRMEVLCPGYLLFRTTEYIEDPVIDFFDSMYLIDVEEKAYYEIQDREFIKDYSNRFIIGQGEEAKILFDDFYLNEEEQYEALINGDIASFIEMPDTFDENQLYVNSIKVANLKQLIEDIKAEKEKLSLDSLDQIDGEGSIRILGETEEAIYYKKQYYDFILQERGDFMSLRRIGSYEVHKIDKKSLEISYLRNVYDDAMVRTNANRAYTIIADEQSIKVQDFDTEKVIYKYARNYLGNCIEEESLFLNDEYLVIAIENPQGLKDQSYLLVDVYSNEILLSGFWVEVIGDCLFVM